MVLPGLEPALYGAMFQDEASITRQQLRERNYVPPYCPRPTCRHHQSASADFFERYGTNQIKRFPYTSQKFRCKTCRRIFTASFFKIYYRQKIWGFNKFISHGHNEGYTKRSMARAIECDETMVRRRLIAMSRWAQLKHLKLTENCQITEPIVFDGLENFSFSQYEPNNINHAAGQESLFMYDFNFCPLNRKGRMTEKQKIRRAEIEKKHGHFPKDAIRTSTKRVLERLVEKSNDLYLFTDEHFQYEKVVKIDLCQKNIKHTKINSRDHRNYGNPLFAVNHIDLQARQTLAMFRRETISFAKHSIAMQESFVLFLAYRNYMRPKFWKPQVFDPECHKQSPAMIIGLTEKILSFDEFYGERVLPSQVKMSEDWHNLYHRHDPLSRRPIAGR